MAIDTSLPFALAYIDWCKAVKEATSLEATQRRDWAYEFGKLYSDAGGNVTGLDLAIALGKS